MFSSLRASAGQLLRKPGVRIIPPLGTFALYLLGMVIGADWHSLSFEPELPK